MSSTALARWSKGLCLALVGCLTIVVPGSTQQSPPARSILATGQGGAASGRTGGGPVAGMFEDLQYLTGSALNTRLDQYAQLGVKLARFQMIWSTVQRGGSSSYDWSNYDVLVDGLDARGIKALPVIDTTPTWARPAGCTSFEVCAPADPNQYGAFAGTAAGRYAPRGVHTWEIWNEPNSSVFWKPAANAGAYTAVLKAAYGSIHHADPAAIVLTGGLAPTNTANGGIAPLEFLSAVYNDGAQGSFDAVGWHPYDYPALPLTRPDDAWMQMSSTSPSVRSLMIGHGDGSKRIWATEFGAPTCTGNSTCVTEAQQAGLITEAYGLWVSYAWAGPLVVYSYQDRGTDQTNREDFFGLVRADGSLKPAFGGYRAVALAPL